eukprot:1322781-Pleurochrysis_carterae.AAC.1
MAGSSVGYIGGEEPADRERRARWRRDDSGVVPSCASLEQARVDRVKQEVVFVAPPPCSAPLLGPPVAGTRRYRRVV